MTPHSPTVFRAFGYLTLAFAAILFLLFLANLRSRLLYHGPNYSLLLAMSIYCGLVSIGLIRQRKWGVTLFVLSMMAVGLFMIVRGAIETPFPWTLVNIGLGILCCLPSIPAVHCWKQLR